MCVDDVWTLREHEYDQAKERLRVSEYPHAPSKVRHSDRLDAVFGREGLHARLVRADLAMGEEGLVPARLHPRSEQNDMPGRSASI
jgi:hypothetical protein